MSKLLLQENSFDNEFLIKPLYENEYNLSGEKVKRLKLQGDAITCEVAGINGRSYPKIILEPEVNRFIKKYLNRGRAISELNHPRLNEDGEGKDYSVFEMNLSKACSLIEVLRFNGNKLFCKVRVCDKHPAGQMLKSLVDDGYVPGFSLRGAGSVIDSGKGYMEIADDYRLITIDVVGNPSFDEQALCDSMYESLKGNKISIITESVETARKEFIANVNIATKIRHGRKQFNRKALVNFFESIDNKTALF